MKLSSKPISSPSRTDKFPPPLMRFLRNNGGSRSRGRSSRSSPMFVRKKNTTAIETQEPSSPKVTCMGQVRVKRSKQAESKNGSTSSTGKKHKCGWVPKGFFCNHFDRKSKNWTSRLVCGKWFVVFQMGFRRKVVEAKEETEKREIKLGETEEEGESEEGRVFASSSPPKNALLLMRCRSAPLRASSLTNRFWGSASASEDAGEQKTEQEEEEEKPTLESEPISKDSAAESRRDLKNGEKLGFGQGFECLSNERTNPEEKSSKNGGGTVGDSNKPLMLTRSKSEPARRLGKLDPDEIYFWKKTRYIEQRPPHVYD